MKLHSAADSAPMTELGLAEQALALWLGALVGLFGRFTGLAFTRGTDETPRP